MIVRTDIKTEVYRIDDPNSLSDKDLTAIKKAGETIKHGGLAVFPTETVYGLGASAFDPNAAGAVYAAKGRPSDNPLIVHVAKPEDAEKFAYVTDTYRNLAKGFMPGALTVILGKKSIIPDEVTGGLDTVAIRCPSNPIAQALIRAAGVPVAAPSANLSGKPSPTKAEHVVRDLSGRVDMILDGGDCMYGLESTVLKPEGGNTLRLLRPGAVTAEMLSNAGYRVIIDEGVTDVTKVRENPESPGMKYKHYSPDAKVILLDTEGSHYSFTEAVGEFEKNSCDSFAVLCKKEDAGLTPSRAVVYTFDDKCGEDDMAHELFSCLRAADDAGVGRIYIPVPQKSGIGLAVYNRVARAAGGRIINVQKELSE